MSGAIGLEFPSKNRNLSENPEQAFRTRLFFMAGVGKIFVVVGGVFLVTGIILIFVPRIPFFGKLPGDIHVKRDNFEIYFPIATSVLLSLIVSGILWAISHFGRK